MTLRNPFDLGELPEDDDILTVDVSRGWSLSSPCRARDENDRDDHFWWRNADGPRDLTKIFRS